jgi:hypothetical protein
MRKYWHESNKLVSEDEYYEMYKKDLIGNKKSQKIIAKF